MFFDQVEQILEIAKRTGAALFVLPDELEINLPKALVVKPEEKTTITIEQMRELLAKTELKQTEDLFVIIRPAEKLGLEAANAFLKTLEEPGDKIHFVLVSSRPSMILPTIMSRVRLYYMRINDDGVIHVDDKTKEVAKQLLVAKGVDLVNLAEKISKKKEAPRAYALSVVGAAVEMLYKSYYLTGKEIFLKRLPRFLELYDNLSRNGHIKLHIVAELS